MRCDRMEYVMRRCVVQEPSLHDQLVRLLMTFQDANHNFPVLLEEVHVPVMCGACSSSM